jgi:REP element-mobilizing transposase RayT
MGMGKPSQLSLLPECKAQREHGGELAIGKRKTRRPLDPRKALHVVLRSPSAEPKSSSSFLRKEYRSFIKEWLFRLARSYGITVYRFSTNSTHLHLLIRLKDRKGFQTFLRVFCGKIAQRVTGAVKGSRQTGKFWLLPFTRIVEWGRAFGVARSYVEQNEKEADGILSYRPRKTKYRRTIPPQGRTVREVVN